MNKQVRITNGQNTITLGFIDDDIDVFLTAVKECLANDRDFIEYQDKTDFILFSATYLKNSLIIVPN